jgi:hypothetical protein
VGNPVGKPACFYDGDGCQAYNGCTRCSDVLPLGGGVFDCYCQHS